MSSFLSSFNFSAKTMHARGPLQAHNSAFDARQKPKGKCCNNNGPNDHLGQHGRLIISLNKPHQGNHQMAHHDDGEIGGRIIGPLMAEVFAAMVAFGGNF